MSRDATFILRLDPGGDGPRLAVKDLVDVVGVPTTAGCRALADIAEPASADAACLAGARAAGARIVGKANLHELAFGGTGVNGWFGTPVNPLDPGRVPGGSSSGSAVAVATDEADVAYGSDTGGSVRIPSACCGTAGLKTTWGRVSTAGVWPLAESLDTVGPMARDVAGLVRGMRLLEPGFEPATDCPPAVARFRFEGTDPAIDAAIDRVLAAAEVEVVEVTLARWGDATRAALDVLLAEPWRNDRHLYDADPGGIGADVLARLELGRDLEAGREAAARSFQQGWREELAAVIARSGPVVLPTLPIFAPRLDEDPISLVTATVAVNLAGNPALSLPVPSGGPLPAGLQVVGLLGGEEQLLALGARLEAAAAA